MKKRLCILLLVLCALLLLPHAASANAPAPDPTRMTVKVKNLPDGTVFTVLLAGSDGVFREAGAYKAVNGSFVFYCEEGDTQFYIVYRTDGGDVRTDVLPLTPQGTYELRDGTLKDRTSSESLFSGLGYIGLFVAAIGGGFLLALAATILIEFLTGLCFGMKPFRYILFANLITNPAMNIILLVLSLLIGGQGAGYWISLAVLEVLAVGIEILFYRKKYRGRHSMKRIVLFTVVANVLSCAAGSAISLWGLWI